MTKTSLRIGLGLIFVVAWVIQKNIFLNWDVSWLSRLAENLYNNGIDKNNFFEVNSPMSIYIYLPVVFINKLFLIGKVNSFMGYLFICAALSLWMCWSFLKKITTDWLAKVGLLFLAVIMLLLPSSQFGQREHIGLILIIPYLFSVIAFLQNKSIRWLSAISVGVLAAIGFSIKPFFIVTFAMIELYCIYYRRDFFAWFRMESLVIISGMVSYLLSIWFLQPGYFSEVIPLARQYYYLSTRSTWDVYLYDLCFLYCLFSLVVLLALQKKNNIFANVLSLAVMGFLIAYLLQGVPAYYRILPAFSLSILLMWIVFSEMRALLIVALIFPIYCLVDENENALWFKKVGYFNEIIAYMDKNLVEGSSYFISTAVPFPEVDYVDNKKIELNSSAPLPFWWLTGLMLKEKNPNAEDKNKFINKLADILDTKKPEFVWVDKRIYLHQEYQLFDYLGSFSKNIQFNHVWKNYSYTDSVYFFDIYKRISPV